MKNYINNKEYMNLVNDIINNAEFKKLKGYKHHGDNRKDHSIRVSYYSFLLSKRLHLNSSSVAKAGLLHDFFFINNQELDFVTRTKVLFNHPKIALDNSNKYFSLTKMEKNIIRSHMFPIGLTLPKYKESILVNLIDDYFSVYERILSVVKIINNKLRNYKKRLLFSSR